MKFFGRYLVEHGLVSNDDLLAALVQQVKNSPSLAEIIYQHHLLTIEQQLQVLEIQSRQRLDYGAAAKSAGIWTLELESSIFAAIARASQPLGEILIEQGKLSFDALIKALDDYVVDVEDDLEMSAKKVLPSAVSADTAPVVKPVAFVAPEPEPATPASNSNHVSLGLAPATHVDCDPILLAELINLFSTEQRQALEDVTSTWVVLKSGSEFDASLQQTIERIRTLRAVARFVKADMLAALLSQIELTMMAVKNRPVSNGEIKNLISIMATSVPILWEIKDFIEKSGSETAFLNTPSYPNYLGVIELTRGFLSTLSTTTQNVRERNVG